MRTNTVPTITITMRLPVVLADRLQAYVASRDALTCRTGGMRLLLDEALERAGFPGGVARPERPTT